MSSVNNPKHYNTGNIEVIDYIEDQGWGVGFCLGNAIKYISRAGKKDASKTIEDLEKAEWYLRRAIEVLRAEEQGRPSVPSQDVAAPGDSKDEGVYIETPEEAEAWKIMSVRGNA